MKRKKSAPPPPPGGDSPHIGNVLIGGRPICDDSWDFSEAHVVCKQLGYPEALRASKESEFGIVSSDFAMVDVRCTGFESQVHLCPHTEVGRERRASMG